MNKEYLAFSSPKKTLSASGGAFISIAYDLKKIYEDLVVFGVTFDKNMDVVTLGTSDINELSMFQGSKYVFSKIDGVFDDISSLLKKDIHVLFSGTPCQVSALINYLEKNNINTQRLFCIDIVCHGAPTGDIWNVYINYIEKKFKKRIIKYNFRYWDDSKNKETVYVEFDDGFCVMNNSCLDYYINIYRKNLIMRNCCYNCKYKTIHSGADITLGDFWGIENILPSFKCSHKVSVIIQNTEKGKHIKDSLVKNSDEKTYICEVKLDKYDSINWNLSHSTPKPQLYNLFKQELDKKGGEYVLKKYGNDTFFGRMRRKISNLVFQIF